MKKPLRHIYIFLMMSLLVWGLCVLAYFGYYYQNVPPLRVNVMQTPPENPVAFPAVAICSNSVISKKELEKYTTYLFEKELRLNYGNMTYDKTKIGENLEKFGAMVTLRTSDVEMLNFMRFLYTVEPNFNITDLMYSLSPKCSSMLSICRWRGRVFPCDRVFATRLTPLGFCCVFNARYHPEDINTPPKVLDLLGKNYGLTVAVHQDSDDFAVVRQPASFGLTVLMFDGGDFPLLEGGAVRAYNVDTNASIYFQLTANVQYATEELKAFNYKKRQCHLMLPTGPRSARSTYSWCLAECRRKTIYTICDCQHFWYRPPPSVTVCTPEHLYCLNKHREKFIYYYPGDVEEGILEEEVQDSLDCQTYGCLPDCARIIHTAKVFKPAYIYPKKLYKNAANTNTISLANKSLLRFYYDSMTHRTYRVDLNSFWYEVVATISCQSRFLVGASLISFAELVFHLTIRWAHHFVRRTREERERIRKLPFH